ncbi:crotonase/enoyl-CoA hydratase family protein [Halomonas halocynthiae]|uniref:crotonase/enoyl-CoA hydratase family protein n=1 Tax=Halomonas halocynthiae TaxID=176290 RepID=UPI000408450E|nr:crotonase/enoyl-CoA hydratase family protein [Halomonas halocynthiae]
MSHTLSSHVCHEMVQLAVVDHVAEVRMVRADRHNGLDWAMIDGLLEAQRRLVQHQQAHLGDIRALVLSGDGESFCAGLDMADIMTQPQRLPSLLKAADDGINPVQRLALGWRDVGVPVLAALQGHVYGGGLQIALGADIRIAHPQARLALLEIDWGIMPDMGISVTAAGMRADVISEMAWSGRRVIAEEAFSLGLVSRLADDPLQAAMEAAQAIAGRSPRAVSAFRELMQQAPSLSEKACLAQEARLQSTLLGGAEQQEAVAARLQRRAAKFD